MSPIPTECRAIDSSGAIRELTGAAVVPRSAHVGRNGRENVSTTESLSETS